MRAWRQVRRWRGGSCCFRFSVGCRQQLAQGPLRRVHYPMKLPERQTRLRHRQSRHQNRSYPLQYYARHPLPHATNDASVAAMTTQTKMQMRMTVTWSCFCFGARQVQHEEHQHLPAKAACDGPWLRREHSSTSRAASAQVCVGKRERHC